VRESAGPVEKGRISGGQPGDHAAPGIIGHRNPKTVAKRRPDEAYVPPAGRAKGILRGERRLAGQADRWDDKIGNPSRGLASTVAGGVTEFSYEPSKGPHAPGHSRPFIAKSAAAQSHHGAL
jgi:hypothetical protein